MLGPVRMTLNFGSSRRTFEMTGAPVHREESPTVASARLKEAKVPVPPTSDIERSRISTFQVKGWMEMSPMASLRPVACSNPFEASRFAMPGTTQATSAAAPSASATARSAAPPTHFHNLDGPVPDTCWPYYFFAPSGV